MKITDFMRKGLMLLLALLAAPTVFLVRILRPFIVVRFGPLFSKRIGHFAINTEIYLCEREAGLNGKRTIDLFYYKQPVSNYQLKRMWDRTLNVLPFHQLLYITDKLNRLLPGYEAHVIPKETKKDRDINGLLSHTPAHLSFIPEEEERGQSELLKIGIPKGASFVCFHVRDSAYLDVTYPQYNWSRHNFRDCNIKNCLPVMEELVRRGYYVIRMGAVVKNPLDAANPKIIDYAAQYRTDFLDIYLSAKCHFFVGSASGLDQVPTIFRKPVVYLNFIPLEYVHSWGPQDLFIPKKLYFRKEGRSITFPEILSSDIGLFNVTKSEKYNEFGIDIIENTPEEISAVVIEMSDRLNHKWQTTPEDEELQRRFWLLFKNSRMHGKILTRIGGEFLRQNRQLLS